MGDIVRVGGGEGRGTQDSAVDAASGGFIFDEIHVSGDAGGRQLPVVEALKIGGFINI